MPERKGKGAVETEGVLGEERINLPVIPYPTDGSLTILRNLPFYRNPTRWGRIVTYAESSQSHFDLSVPTLHAHNGYGFFGIKHPNRFP